MRLAAMLLLMVAAGFMLMAIIALITTPTELLNMHRVNAFICGSFVIMIAFGVNGVLSIKDRQR